MMRLQRDLGWLKALADLLFPPHCLGCGAALAATVPPLFCRTCQDDLPWITPPLCICCGTPFQAGASHLCGACLVKAPAFNLARSLFRYQDPLRSHILALKFQRDLALLPSLVALCGQAVVYTELTEPDYMVPVPLHPIRLRERGFNQALHLARSCFPQWQDRIAPQLLLRLEHSPPQTSLGGRARRRNLHGVFSVAKGVQLAGKKVLLVDDVFTTGTTVEACSQALHEAGAARIEVLTLARSVVR
ncbi:MAG: ComF family protein [bacterium]|nr:ComF family protein [bacterium]